MYSRTTHTAPALDLTDAPEAVRGAAPRLTRTPAPGLPRRPGCPAVRARGLAAATGAAHATNQSEGPSGPGTRVGGRRK